MSRINSPSISPLPPDVVMSVRNVSKKFCRNLRRSMLYGIRDLGFSLLGMMPRRCHETKTEVLRHGAEPLTELGHEVTQSGVCCSGPGGAHSAPLRRDEFWALRDVSLELKRGEVLGLMGVNGSGKTTLLRVLAGIFPPDDGEVTVRGRIGALIALGAGFHPHLTGRENIFLNGAILGVPQAEIAQRLDDIVSFAGVGDFLEAPVATYSSGMKVRLGYAIAARLSADIILIDEVLAVGDLAFRDKCFRNISSMLADGRSFILVSHNMVDIARSCTRAIVMKSGRIVHDGGVEQAIDIYRSEEEGLSNVSAGLASEELCLTGVRANGRPWVGLFQTEFRSDLDLDMECECSAAIVGVVGVVNVLTTGGLAVTSFRTDHDEFSVRDLLPGVHRLRLTLPRCPLLPGRYRFIFRLLRPGSRSAYARTAGGHELLVTGGLPLSGCVDIHHMWSLLTETASGE